MPNNHRVLLGRYVQANSLLVRLDPRAKLLVVSLVLGSLVATRTPSGLVPAGALFALGAASSRLSFGVIFGGLRGIGWFLLITFLFQIFLVPGGGEILAKIGSVALTAEGLTRAIGLSLALLMTLLFANLLTLTTSPVDVADALRATLAPLARLRVPVEDLALVALITLRFVPTLLDEAERIRKAQIARGLAPGRGLLARVRASLPLFVPLIEGAFRKSDELAVALEARGYEPNAVRTSYRQLAFAARDVVAVALGCAAAGATLWLAFASRTPA
ncbi:MAG: energy-coupling factor transporter transmembrane component T family protein [bacterium]